MSYNHDGLRVPACFLRDLRRHIVVTYQKAEQEAAQLHKFAENLYPKAHRAYFTPTTDNSDSITESQTEIIDHYFDYHMRSRSSAARAARYQNAFDYVSQCDPQQIDIAHPAVEGISCRYLQWWQMRWIREQREIAQGMGLELTFTRQQNISADVDEDDNSVEDDKQFSHSECDDYDEDEHYDEDEESVEEVDQRWGRHEVYSSVIDINQVDEEEYDEEAEQPEPEPQDVPLEAFIAQSSQRELFNAIAYEYLNAAELVGIERVKKLRLRRELLDALSWAQRNSIEDEADIRSEIQAMLDDGQTVDERLFPPTFQRRTSGYGRIMQSEIQYEGSSSEGNWSPIDDV